MDKALLFGTLMTPPSPQGDDLRKVYTEVEWLEVRTDLMGDIDPDWLRSRFCGSLLFTLRSTAEGGRCDAPPSERHPRLLRAAEHYDLVDLESERDLVPEVLAHIPPHKRLISWAGPAADLHELCVRARRITQTEARLYRLVPAATCAGEGISPLALLRSLNRRDVTAFAAGEAGVWTRLVAPHLGAPVVFGAIGHDPRPSGEPSIAQLVLDYGLPALLPLGDLYGIVGNPVSHSLSPRLHNAAYRVLGVPALFVPFQEQSFDGFWRDMVRGDALPQLGASIKGLTVVSPYKEAALRVGTSGSATVRRAGATNIVVRNGNGWSADTTDPQGVVLALCEREIAIERQRAAVVGCGGAGRAIASTLSQLGADVTLVNRGLDRGLRAQTRLGLRFTPLAKFSADDYSLVVNATPVGRSGESLPFDIGKMRTGGAVVDLTYGREPTPLIDRGRLLGLTTIDGLEVLLIQVLHQFRLMTGLDMPGSLTRERDVMAESANGPRCATVVCGTEPVLKEMECP